MSSCIYMLVMSDMSHDYFLSIFHCNYVYILYRFSYFPKIKDVTRGFTSTVSDLALAISRRSSFSSNFTFKNAANYFRWDSGSLYHIVEVRCRSTDLTEYHLAVIASASCRVKPHSDARRLIVATVVSRVCGRNEAVFSGETFRFICLLCTAKSVGYWHLLWAFLASCGCLRLWSHCA